jgi:ABC-type nitrate/sulfonate/bicarbonate transport system permease component
MPPGTLGQPEIRPARRARFRPGRALAGLAGLAGLAVIVEAVPRLGVVSPTYLPPTSVILRALGNEVGRSTFWSAVGQTLLAWAIGLAIAFVAAVVLGLVIGTSRVLRAYTASTIEFLRPIPSVALIPLAILIFATGIRSALLLIVYASFWQVLVQVLYGVADVDPVATDTARSYRFHRLAHLRYVTLPAALPFVLTGLRLAAAVALILAVTAGLVIGTPGLGSEIATAQSGGAVADMYALIAATGLIGVAVNAAVRWLERRLLFWHPSVRGEVPA